MKFEIVSFDFADNAFTILGDVTNVFRNGVQLSIVRRDLPCNNCIPQFNILFTSITVSGSDFHAGLTTIVVNEDISSIENDPNYDDSQTKFLAVLGFYEIDLKDREILVEPQTINSETSLDLPGKGYLNYGELINKNLISLLENFANSNSNGPRNPTVGQLWFNTIVEKPYFYTETNGWTPVGSFLQTEFNQIFEAIQILTNTGNVLSPKFKHIEQNAGDGQTTFVRLPSYSLGNNSLWAVYVNGIFQHPGISYLEEQNAVTFMTPLNSYDRVTFSIFNLDSTNGVSNVIKQQIIPTNGQTIFTVPSSSTTTNQLFVWVNGVKQIKNISFQHINPTTIEFSEPLTENDVVDIAVIQLSGSATIDYQRTPIPSSTNFITVNSPYNYLTNPFDSNSQHVVVFINGILQGPNSYAEVGGHTIRFTEHLQSNDEVELYIFKLN